jgi:predicted negative regulator of RcsB-dependent stress response
VASESTEEEQVEAIKSWFDQNGTSLVVGIVVSLVAVFGYQGWQESELASTENASSLYSDLTEAIVVGPLEPLTSEQISTGKFLAAQLKTEYPDSSYAHFAALHLAKLAVEADDLETAGKELEWIRANNPARPIELIANLRLAKVMTAQKQYDAALALLDIGKVGAHVSSYQEQRGDIFLAMGKSEQAREAYKLAMDTMLEDQNKPVLQMKFEDLIDPQSTAARGSAESLSEADAKMKDGAG